MKKRQKNVPILGRRRKRRKNEGKKGNQKMIQIKKAKRSAAKIKIGMSGLSGSGKTMSA